MIRPNHVLVWILGIAVVGLSWGTSAGWAQEDAEALEGLFEGGSLTLQDLMRAADYLDRQRNTPKDYEDSVDSAIQDFEIKRQRQLQIGPDIIQSEGEDPADEELEQETTTDLELVDP